MSWTEFDPSGFPPVSKEAWVSKATKDLKGKELEALRWQYDELNFEPMSFKEDLDFTFNIPPRSIMLPRNEWQIIQDFRHVKENLNEKIIRSLMHGSQGLVLNSDQWNHRGTTLKGVHLNMVDVQVISEGDIQEDDGLIDLQSLDFESSEPVNQSLEEQLMMSKDGKRAVLIPTTQLQEHGVSTVDSMAFSLLAAYDLLSRCDAEGKNVDELGGSFQVEIAVGKNYLAEIAMIRAFRVLWAKMIDVFNPHHECSKLVFIQSVTSKANQSGKDPYNNLLRSTTAAMSAVLGGTDSLVVTPFDFWWDDSERGLRYARNIHHLLNEESHLSAVIDPLKGSYSVEIMTNKFVEKTWLRFQTLAEGGWLNDHRESIKNTISQANQTLSHELISGSKTWLGVNLHEGEGREEMKSRAQFRGFPWVEALKNA